MEKRKPVKKRKTGKRKTKKGKDENSRLPIVSEILWPIVDHSHVHREENETNDYELEVVPATRNRKASSDTDNEEWVGMEIAIRNSLENQESGENGDKVESLNPPSNTTKRATKSKNEEGSRDEFRRKWNRKGRKSKKSLMILPQELCGTDNFLRFLATLTSQEIAEKETDPVESETSTAATTSSTIVNQETTEETEISQSAASTLSLPQETILYLGGSHYDDVMTVLSDDRSHWTRSRIKMPGSLISGAAICVNQEIYLIGGFPNNKGLQKLEIQTREWINLAEMNVGRVLIQKSTVEMNGFIWVLGGEDSRGKTLKSVELYDPRLDVWAKIRDMHYARSRAAATVWNEKIFICGGIGDNSDDDNSCLKSVECFDPESGIWTLLVDMPAALCDHTLLTHKNRLILMGGRFGSILTTAIAELEEENGRWKPAEKMPDVPMATGVVLDGEIYALGGLDEMLVATRRVEIFDGNRWRWSQSLPYTWNHSYCIIVPRELAQSLSVKMANNPLNKLYEALQMYEIQDAEKQAEINKLKAENQELTERVKSLEEQIKDYSQGKRSKDDPIMQMYEAQAIALEKQVEVDRLKEEMEKMKEEMERLKKEKEEMFELVKQLGKEQRAAATYIEPTSRNMELDILKEKAAKIDEMKKKNEELEKRLRRLEMNREGGSDVLSSSSHTVVRDTGRRGFENNEPSHLNTSREWAIVESPVLNQWQRNTILVVGWSRDKGKCLLVLSADRNKWIEIDLKLPDRSWHGGAVYLDEEFYIICGSIYPKNLHKLDKTLKWRQMADMNIRRAWITNSCLELNGYIWVLGGMDDEYEKLTSVERYDPKENKWTLMPAMKYTRCRAAAATWNNGIVISGGCVDRYRYINTVECFNPETGSRMELPNMPKPLYGHSLVSYKNKLIVMGGYGGKMLNSVWQLDPSETNPKWRPLPSMKYPSSYFAGIVFDEEIYAIGGVGEGYDLNRVEIFDGKQWRAGPSLLYRMCDTSVMMIPQHFADRLCNYQPE